MGNQELLLHRDFFLGTLGYDICKSLYNPQLCKVSLITNTKQLQSWNYHASGTVEQLASLAGLGDHQTCTSNRGRSPETQLLQEKFDSKHSYSLTAKSASFRDTLAQPLPTAELCRQS